MDLKNQDNGREKGHGEARPPARPRSGAGRPPAEAPRVPAVSRGDDVADAATRIQPPPQRKPNSVGELLEGADGGDGKKQKEKKPKGKVKKSTVVKVMALNVLKALFVLFCIAAMVGSIAAVQVVQYVVEATENDDALLDLEHFKGAQTSSFMALNPENPNAKEEDDWITYQELVGDEDRIWVAIDDIPENLINAVIATEDREFREHHGVNWQRTVAALVNEIIPVEGMRGGASTIDQQLIKNITDDDVVVGEDGDRTEGYKRKLREIYRAYGLRNRYSQDMIMEAYLNTIGLSERIAGVGAGAKRYFAKEVKDLTLAECAVIAGITQYPTKYSPIQNPEESLKRRNDVLYFMWQAGYISESERDAAYDEPLGLNTGTAEQKQAQSIFSYFSDKAYDDIIRDLVAQNINNITTPAEAKQYLYNGGLKVYLTVDLRIQDVLDGIMTTGYDEETGFFKDETRFPGYVARMTKNEEIKNSAGVVVGYHDVLPQAAVAIVNYDGELVATSGGIGEKTSSLSLNRSIGTVTQNAAGEYVVRGSVRQNGSTQKPVSSYAVGIDYGIIHYSKMVLDEGIMVKDGVRDEDGRVLKDWPKNFGTTRHTKIPVVSAVAESTNTVPCQIAMWIGLPELFTFLTDTLQFSSLVDPADMGPAPLVLGSQTYGVCPYELAGAYTIFGGNETYGVYNSLHCYTKVEDALGNIIMEPEITTVQAVSPSAGYVINKLLENVIGTQSWPGGASPTARGMRPVDAEGNAIPSVAKTGTTSEDNDRWFVGMTPNFVTAVWWGYDVEHKLDGWTGSNRLTTGNIPVNLWKTLVETVYPNLTEEEQAKQFPEMPEGVAVERWCTVSGELARAGCPSMEGYYVREGGMPGACPGHGSSGDEEGEGEGEAPPA